MKNLRRILVAASLLASGSVSAAVISVTDSTFGAFDDSSGTRTFAVGGGTVQDVTIRITFGKCDDPAITSPGACIGSGFSFNSEIVFRLTDALGHTVNLVNAGTYSGQEPGAGSQTVLFDDSAATVVGGSAVVSGTFRPVGSLSAFDGFNAAGNWTLFIEDTVGADPLSYFSSTLTVTTVPVPGALALLGFGLLGFGLRRQFA